MECSARRAHCWCKRDKSVSGLLLLCVSYHFIVTLCKMFQNTIANTPPKQRSEICRSPDANRHSFRRKRTQITTGIVIISRVEKGGRLPLMKSNLSHSYFMIKFALVFENSALSLCKISLKTFYEIKLRMHQLICFLY